MDARSDVEAVIAAMGASFRTEHVCPSCDEVGLMRVHDCDAAHLLCGSCGQCWSHAEHGALRTADPLSCEGCRDQPKEVCLARLATDFPQFGSGPSLET